jgi:hypothetical protein
MDSNQGGYKYMNKSKYFRKALGLSITLITLTMMVELGYSLLLKIA